MKNNLLSVLFYYSLINKQQLTLDSKKIVCPLHKDINASMIVDPEKDYFYCFGCQKYGNSIDLVAELENISELQAIIKLKKILKSEETRNIDQLNLTINKKVKKSKKQALIESFNYYDCLSSTMWKTTEDQDVISVRNYICNRGYTIDTIKKCKMKFNFNVHYPLIIPMLENGKFKGYICRTIDPEIEKQRKYLYNEGFRRKECLIGTHGANKVLIITEGYLDQVKILQAAPREKYKYDIVSLLGWKASDLHLQKIKEGNYKYIVSALDNDTKGKEGTEYLKLKLGNVKSLKYLKGFKDPGSVPDEKLLKMLKKTMGELKDGID